MVPFIFLPTLDSFVFLIITILEDVRQYLIVFFICFHWWLMMLSTFMLSTCKSFFENNVFSSPLLMFNWLFEGFSYWVLSSLYILYITLLPDIWFANIYFHYVEYFFNLLSLPSLCRVVLFDVVPSAYFSLWLLYFGWYLIQDIIDKTNVKKFWLYVFF